DALDDPDLRSDRIQRIALLDMGFEVADIARRIDELARPSGKPGIDQRLAQLLALAALGRLDLIFAQPAGKRPAAEHVAVMPFFVGPGDRLNAEPGERGISGEGARQFEPIDDAERAVEPATMWLGLAVRADQQPPLGMRIASDHIAD